MPGQRSKIWLRSTMTQERLGDLKILNGHKERTARLSLVDIANEFADRNDNRKRNLGTFFCFIFILIDAPFMHRCVECMSGS